MMTVPCRERCSTIRPNSQRWLLVLMVDRLSLNTIIVGGDLAGHRIENMVFLSLIFS